MKRVVADPRRKGERGSMLIEAAIAVFVLSLAAVTCLAVISATAGASDAARQNVIALNAARHVIENMRNFKSAKIPAGTYTDATQFGPVEELTQLNGGTVSATITSPSTVLKQAIITVNWKSGERSQRRTRILTALFAGNGVAP